MIRIWIDDERPIPNKYDMHIKSVYEFITRITSIIYRDGQERKYLIDLDHDAGMYARDGGDYIKILEYLEFLNHEHPGYLSPYKFIFKIHSGNPVGRDNMKRIIEANGWEYQE